MKKILITGYSGFVGIRLLNYLKTLKIEIILLGRKQVGSFKHYNCDFLKDEIPKEAFFGVDTIFHLAAYTHDFANKKNNKKYEDLNINLTKKIINLCLINNTQKFIYLSSTKVYKKNNINLINESCEEDADEIYGISKLESEKYIKETCLKNKKLKYLIIRSPLVYGPGVKGNLKIMQKAIRLRIMPPLPFSNNKKSLVHVDDLVKSLCLFLTNDNCLNNVFIVTDGKTYSSREIYEIICTINGINFKNKIDTALLYKIFLSFPLISNRLQKLFSNDYFSCELIMKYGFKPSKLLKDMNETNF